MKTIILYFWQLPQHLFALILWGILKLSKRVVYIEHGDMHPQNTFIIVRVRGWGVSLGKYILLDECHNNNTTKNHERGHSIQSLFLGPLYLLAIGIPSAVFNNLWDRLFHKKWDPYKRIKWYYNRYPEKWADMLGGVKRIA
jgi:hypothetical protein